MSDLKNKEWKELKVTLQALLDLDISQRRERLDELNVDPAIRREVESLIGLECEAEKIMNLSAIDFAHSFSNEISND